MGNKDGRVYQKLRDSARGETCKLRIVDVCNHDPETTVLAHLDSEFKGFGIKTPDYIAIHSCSGCHAALDQRRISKEARMHYMLRGLMRQLKWWIDNGYLEVA